MDHFLKTDLGIQTLKQRSIQLNARERQLLLLIGTADFKILNLELKKRLATPERLQQLEDLGLIFQNKVDDSNNKDLEITADNEEEKFEIKNNATLHIKTEQHNTLTLQTSKIQVSEKLILNTSPVLTETVISQKIEAIQAEITCISFDEIQQKMIDLLKTYCGLMAQQLISNIQHASTLRDIKRCQMQWITALQESKISPLELNRTMQQVNHSIHNLQSA